MSPLSPPIQALLELFQGPLAEVRFADVDAAGLSQQANLVDSAAVAVAEQEARLALLRQTLVEQQDALAVLAQRALAYARVYAEQDDALTEQLTRIALPRASKPRKVNARVVSESTSTVPDRSPPPEPAVTEAPATLAAEAVADATTDSQSPDSPALEAPAPRKGKRRSVSVTQEEAHSPAD
jgi:hypothetical protein